MSEHTSSGVPPIAMYDGAVEVTGYRDIQAILKDPEFLALADRTRNDFLGGTLPHVDGPVHRRLRRVHSNLFRREALEFYEHQVVAPAIQDALDDLRAANRDDEIVRADLVHLSRRMLSDMGCRLIGLGDLSDAERRARFQELVQRLISGIVNDNSTAPDGEREAELRSALAAKQEFWEEFAAPALESHRDRLRNGELPNSVADALDLLTLLLADDPEISDELILHNCLLYISGSQGAVVQTVAHTITNLTAWVEAHPDRASELGDVTFLLRAVNETLRVTPSQGILPRVAGCPATREGHEIAEGQVVALNLLAAHRNESIFGAEPERVDPDRGEAPAGVQPYGLAFGSGVHACIGRRLAVPASVSGDRDGEGIVLAMLRALYAAGVRPDPETPPTITASSRNHYQRYPVIFTSL